ncbi:hypothetical protein ACI2OX_20165 [Bacillus sp. N9]
METIDWFVDKDEDNLSTYPQIMEAAQRLQENEVVAFPTETVYGLGRTPDRMKQLGKSTLLKEDHRITR